MFRFHSLHSICSCLDCNYSAAHVCCDVCASICHKGHNLVEDDNPTGSQFLPICKSDSCLFACCADICGCGLNRNCDAIALRMFLCLSCELSTTLCSEPRS